jgi:integrase
MSSVALRKVIQTRTREEFGLPMNPHHIRHSVATEVAELTPENVMDIPAMLAHSASETSERYYNLAGPARAAMKLAEEVEKIRRAERQPRIRRSDAEELIENPLWTLLGRSPR